jgi:acetyl esterase
LQVLICPILDYGRLDSSGALGSSILMDQATLDHDLLYYLPRGTNVADPRISPLGATELAHLPRTLIHTAEYDPLCSQGRKYFDRLRRAGVAASYTSHPGMIHLFYGLGAIIPYARSALGQIGAEIRSALVKRIGALRVE